MSWTSQTVGENNHLQFVFFTGPTGYAVGLDFYPTIIKSSNWGNTWSYLSHSVTNYPLAATYFINPDTGFAVGSGGILKTIDGGATWVKVYSFIGWFYSIFFTDENTGYVSGTAGTLLKTSDGGTNWVPLSSGTTASLASIYFTDANTGFVVGGNNTMYTSDGIILKTTDGGITWSTFTLGYYELHSVFFTDANTGYAVGDYYYSGNHGVILKTIDGGTNWFPVYGPYLPMTAVFFPSTNIGYVIGSQSILKTTDAGTTWAVLTSTAGAKLSAIFFLNDETGYTVGAFGTILKTINGGASWTKQWSKTIQGLGSIFFANNDVGYVTGDKGTILKTTDGGGYPVGSNDLLKNAGSLKIYPNPATTFTTLSLSFNTSVSSLQISLYNLLGNEVKMADINMSQTGYHLDVSTLSDGLYLVIARAGNQIIARSKLLINKKATGL